MQLISWMASQLTRLTEEQVRELTDADLCELAGLQTELVQAVLPLELGKLATKSAQLRLITPATVHGLPGCTIRVASAYTVQVQEAVIVDGEALVLETVRWASYLRETYRPSSLMALSFDRPLNHTRNLQHMREHASTNGEKFCRTRSEYRRNQYERQLKSVTLNFNLYIKVFGLTDVAPLMTDSKLAQRVMKRQLIQKLEGKSINEGV